MTYEQMRSKVDAYFRSAPRGSQAACAKDLRVSPSTLSATIRGRSKYPNLLARIAEWIDTQKA